MGGLDLTSGEAFHKADATASLISKENPKESRLLRILGWEDTEQGNDEADREERHHVFVWLASADGQY